MSTVKVSAGSARISSQVHETVRSTAPSTVNDHWSTGTRGVGPALRTGKSATTYWPGGTRAGSTSRRGRPRKPRETGGMHRRYARAPGEVNPHTSQSMDWGVGRYERTAEQLDPAARALVARATPRPGER